MKNTDENKEWGKGTVFIWMQKDMVDQYKMSKKARKM